MKSDGVFQIILLSNDTVSHLQNTATLIDSTLITNLMH